MTSEIVPLFSTPVVISDLPEAAALNAELGKAIAERHKSHPGTQHSNLGGWQSTWDMDRWGGALGDQASGHRPQPRQPLHDRPRGQAGGRDLARQHVGQRQSSRATATSSIPIPAASGRASTMSTMAASPPIPSLGGELEFMDPRGPGPAMYAPHLAFAMPGGLSVGANEVVHPKTGRLVMFPAWLLHQVRPYRGGAERISIAFNLSL